MESDISELNGPQLIDASVGATSNLVGLQLGADAIVLALCGGC
jgi:thiazole synthase ThiGH ThiG subunit